MENFRAQVQIPLSIPKWLWQGERITKVYNIQNLLILKHPTVKIKLETDKAQGDASSKEKKSERAQALLNHQPSNIFPSKSSNRALGEPRKVSSHSLSRNLMALALDGTF